MENKIKKCKNVCNVNGKNSTTCCYDCEVNQDCKSLCFEYRNYIPFEECEENVGTE